MEELMKVKVGDKWFLLTGEELRALGYARRMQAFDLKQALEFGVTNEVDTTRAAYDRVGLEFVQSLNRS